MADELSLVNNPLPQEEVLSLEEAASKLLITYKALCSWLKEHPEFKEANTFKMDYKGRKRIVIKKVSLIVLATMKSGSRNNQHTKNLAERDFSEAKQTLAENYNQMSEALNNPIVALQREQLEMHLQFQNDMQKKMETMQIELDKVRQLALATPPIDMTNEQRVYLNDRVRNYSIQTGLTFGFVWSKIHQHVGRSAIAEYLLTDYRPAIQKIRSMYEQAGLMWG